jgi:hypothetical protein
VKSDLNDFFKDYKTVVAERRELSAARRQIKILRKYFKEYLNGLDPEAILDTEKPERLMADVRERAASVLLDSIDILIVEEKLDRILFRFFNTKIWKALQELITLKGGRAGIVFPIEHNGDWIAHIMGYPPQPVLRQPKIVFEGVSGELVIVQKLDIFMLENS